MNFERVVGARAFAVWVSLATLFFTAFTHADEAALTPPQKVIQVTADQLQHSLQRPEVKNDFAKATGIVDSIIRPVIDFDRVSIMVLGKYYKTATATQRERFKTEFRRLLVRTYTTAFTEYSDWKINYLPSTDATPEKTTVRTQILQAGGQPVAINYRMVNTKGDWKVYDVLIEGISLLQNYRTSFTNQIGEGGSLDQLIADLTKRNDTAHKEPIPEGESGADK